MKAWLFALALSLPACGRPFAVETASGFVEVDEETPLYDYRAVAPDGVAVRCVRWTSTKARISASGNAP